MKPKRDAWFPFYVGDYLRDTPHLTAEQHGAYLLLILAYWPKGPLPDDDGMLSSIAKVSLAVWKRMRPIIAAFFQVHDGQWHHKRIDKERGRAFGITELRSIAGREGAERRWQRDSKPIANAIAEPMANAKQSDAPSQSQRITSTESGSAREPACDADAPRARREGSGPKKLSEGTSALLKATFEKALKV